MKTRTQSTQALRHPNADESLWRDWSPNPSAHTLSLPEQIAGQIGNAIIRGMYEPGARIQEQDVAAQFEVSRGPVREALRILERDGLVQINARRGAQVTELTIAELNDIFDPRIALNGLMARRAAERADAELVDRFRQSVERLQALASDADADADTYVDTVYQAHQTLADATGNAFLQRLVFLLAHQTFRYARLGLVTTKRRQQSARNWKRLLQAVQSRDGDAAQAIAEQLARDSRDTVIKQLRGQTSPGAPGAASEPQKPRSARKAS